MLLRAFHLHKCWIPTDGVVVYLTQGRYFLPRECSRRVRLLRHAGQVLIGEVLLGQFRAERGRRFLRALPRDDTGDGVVRAEGCDELRFEWKTAHSATFRARLRARTTCARTDGGRQPEGEAVRLLSSSLESPRFRSLDCIIDRRVRRFQGEVPFMLSEPFTDVSFPHRASCAGVSIAMKAVLSSDSEPETSVKVSAPSAHRASRSWPAGCGRAPCGGLR